MLLAVMLGVSELLSQALVGLLQACHFAVHVLVVDHLRQVLLAEVGHVGLEFALIVVQVNVSASLMLVLFLKPRPLLLKIIMLAR